MASSRGYGRRGSNRIADMSLPAEVRLKPKQRKAKKGKKTTRARKQEREDERAMERKR
jgi:hypothetical protein